MKKMICLILCLVLSASVLLTGCESKETQKDRISRGTVVDEDDREVPETESNETEDAEIETTEELTTEETPTETKATEEETKEIPHNEIIPEPTIPEPTVPDPEPPKPHTHSYKSQVTTAATCATEGVKTNTCTECGHFTTEAIAKLAHKYTEKVTTAATCATEGVKTNTCSECGHSTTQAIAKLGHKYTDKVTKPTCTAKGYTTHTCSRCADSYTDTPTNMTKHTYQSKVTTAATCTAEGVKTNTCTACGHAYTEKIAAKGHSWSAWGVAKFANPYENGEERRVCTGCKNVESRVIAKVQGYVGNVFYNINNKAPAAGKITIKPFCVYWKDGNLYAQCYVINGTSGNVKLNNVKFLKISNGNTPLAYDEDLPLNGTTVGPNQYEVWEFRFFGNAGEVSNYGYDLSTLNFSFYIE